MKITKNLSNLCDSLTFNKNSNYKNKALIIKSLTNRNVYHFHNINAD